MSSDSLRPPPKNSQAASMLRAAKVKTFNGAKYAVERYQLQALAMMHGRHDFSGRRVLECGGSNLPRALTLGCLKASQWTSVDYLPTHYDHAKSRVHYMAETILQLNDDSRPVGDLDFVIFNGRVEDLPESFHKCFDICVSICAFEHFSRPELVLAKMKNCLAEGGELHAYFGPIWSCADGHHCWVTPQLNFIVRSHIPDFAHLLLSPGELAERLSPHYDSETVAEALRQIYESDRVNRLFFEDYVRLFQTAGFSRCEIWFIRLKHTWLDEWLRF